MTWSHVQTGGSQPSGAQTSTTIALGSAVTAGNLLLVAVSINDTTDPPVTATVTDNKGNTYSLVTSLSNTATVKTVAYLYSCVVTNGGAGFTLTITPSESAFLAAVADEFSVTGTIAADSTATSWGAAGVTPIAPGNLTISGTDLVYSVLAPKSSAATSGISAGASYTAGTIFTQTTNHIPIGSEYALDVTSSPQDPTWSITANNGWLCLGATWKAVAGGGTSMAARRHYLETNHTAGVAVDLVGTGTSWTQGGTTFTLSGTPAATCSIVTKIVEDATHARLVISTGDVIGSLTISDGTNTATIPVKRYRRPRWFPGL